MPRKLSLEICFIIAVQSSRNVEKTPSKAPKTPKKRYNLGLSRATEEPSKCLPKAADAPIKLSQILPEIPPFYA